MGVLQYADGSHVGWFWLDRGTGFGSVVIWLPGCLVGLVSASEILGLPGLVAWVFCSVVLSKN